MSRYRKVETKLYGDSKFRRLSPIPPCGQGLWLWLLTGPATTIMPGVIIQGPAAMAERLGWPVEDFRKAFQEVLKQGMVKADFTAPLVFLPNAIKHNRPQSPNVIKGWAACWEEIPECGLKTEIWQSLKEFIDTFSKAFQEAFEKACPKPYGNQEQEQEQEQEQDKPSLVDSEGASEDHIVDPPPIEATDGEDQSKGDSKKPKREPKPRRASGKPAPSELDPDQRAALQEWAQDKEPWASRTTVLRDFVEACLGHFGGNGIRKTDWYKTCQNWIRKERLDNSAAYRALTNGGNHEPNSIESTANDLIDEILSEDE